MRLWQWCLGAVLAMIAAGWLLVYPAQTSLERYQAELQATSRALIAQRHQLLTHRVAALAALNALITAPSGADLPFSPLELNRISGVVVTGWRPLPAGGEVTLAVDWPQALELLDWLTLRTVTLKSMVLRREKARLFMQMRLDNDPSP